MSTALTLAGGDKFVNFGHSANVPAWLMRYLMKYGCTNVWLVELVGMPRKKSGAGILDTLASGERIRGDRKCSSAFEMGTVEGSYLQSSPFYFAAFGIDELILQ